jgi:hypothetical protein
MTKGPPLSAYKPSTPLIPASSSSVKVHVPRLSSFKPRLTHDTFLFSIASIPAPIASMQGFVSLYSTLRNNPRLHIIIELEIWNGTRWISTFALIDSGASGNFISSFYLRSFFEKSLSKTKTRSYYLAMANGKSNVVSRECLTQIKIQEHHEHISLDSTILESYPIILGIPWLKQHDPWIQWSSHRITFNSPHCLAHCNLEKPMTITSLPRFPSPSAPAKPTSLSTPESTSLSTPPPATQPAAVAISRPELTKSPSLTKPGVRWKPDSQLTRTKIYDPASPPSTLQPKSKPKPKATARPIVKASPPCVLAPPKVSLIGAAPFSYLLKQPDVQLFQLDITQFLDSPDQNNPDLATIPDEYHEFAQVFSQEESDKLPEHRPYDHKIPLQPDKTPPYGPIYSLSPEELKVLRQYLEDNLRKGFIQNSQSPCAAPILFVKKPDGSLRLCVDYRGLNKITVKNRYPLPLINELFDRLRQAKYFTKLDMKDGYHRLRMADGEEWKTAFRTRYGLYEYRVMPFGLCNAPGTFQFYVNDVFRDYLDDFMSAYLDDLLIYSATLKEHKRHVRLVLQRLADNQLYLKASKCQFHQTQISFLGYTISEAGISMDSAKVDAVTSWPVPSSVLDIQVFLGLANFYRRFIKNFSQIIAPITRLLKKDVQFHWDRAADKAFQALKKAFTSAPVLRHFDFNRPAIVETDASDFAIGGVISQRDDRDGLLHPVAFHSRKFIPAELNYEIYDKEMLAIVECLSTWRHYLQGSDHQSKLSPITRISFGSRRRRCIIVAKLDGQKNSLNSIFPLPIGRVPKVPNQMLYREDQTTGPIKGGVHTRIRTNFSS